MSFELPPGDYALMHANGKSWTQVLAEHRKHVQMDCRSSAFSLRGTPVEEVPDE